MDNKEIRALRLHGISINPALNDGMNGLLRIEAHQWILDARGNVTDIKHRLEANDVESALHHLKDKARHILALHIESKDKTPEDK